MPNTIIIYHGNFIHTIPDTMRYTHLVHFGPLPGPIMQGNIYKQFTTKVTATYAHIRHGHIHMYQIHYTNEEVSPIHGLNNLRYYKINENK